MFGHQESDQKNDEQASQTAPTVSDTLAANLSSDTTNASTASGTLGISDNDSAGSYIMTEPQHSLIAPIDNDDVDKDLPATVSEPKVSGELLELKQKALQQLSPLVGQLDQTPEEKFRTTMMMIQASDDQSLLKSAYESAQQITDEKTKAQALLDIVNEINYFTQQQEA